MTLDNLVKIGRAKQHKAAPDEITRLVGAIRRNLKDARNVDISPESRFDIGYKAAMQCALVAMLASGFRPSTNEPGHHATVIQSLPKTIGLPNEKMTVLDQLRKKRNLSDYSGVGVSEEMAAACVRAAADLADTLEKWLRVKHPDLVDG